MHLVQRLGLLLLDAHGTRHECNQSDMAAWGQSNAMD
ncbi:unnamed protein product [Mycetohabitans rhizoxinica HKI 454]|uniref:Uncharacterized protein n=1 Tax=Mycetohabitans rhizoxinica (strain DSM 19002 / CIP 109453 / HKI 454) TaxID=882378 RepID=E5AKC0_MYCRK|nr:unnamed protein product [Mycetohabitans rhizoxinica HKI 454]